MTQKFNSTVKLFAMTGFAWAVAAAVTGLLSLTQVVYQWPAADALGSYALMRPLYTNMLIFGAGLSFFFAVAYFSIGDEAGVPGSLEWLSKMGWGLQQLGLVLGLAVLTGGSNSGREYGELGFLPDRLIGLSILAFLIAGTVNLAKAFNPQRGSMFSLMAGAGALTVFCLGNLGHPYSFSGIVPFYQGVQDTANQEFYRAGVLGFFILMPVFAALYTGAQTVTGKPVASAPLANFQGTAMMILIPLAGTATLALSFAPAWSWAVGFAAGVVLFVAILAGVLNIQMTLASGNTSPGALYFRIGMWILLAYALLRALAGLPAYQGRYGYTFWDMADISVDMQTYAILILTGAVLLALEKITGKQIAPAAGTAVFYLLLSGTALILLGTILGGVSEASVLSAYAEPGKLASPEWSSVLAAGKTMKMVTVAGQGIMILGLIISGVQAFLMTNADAAKSA